MLFRSVPAGKFSQLIGGEVLAPSQVYSFGNVPLSIKAVLLKVNGVLVGVMMVAISSFLQARNNQIEAMKKRVLVIVDCLFFVQKRVNILNNSLHFIGISGVINASNSCVSVNQ